MRYIIGIDLGTTNCCVAYVDTQNRNLPIQQFRIPQLIAPGYTEALPTLPSYCYLSAPYEWAEGNLHLPWKKESDFFVGRLAQIQGAKVPTRLVQSAKSWLCHSAANRRDKILPFEAADEERRLSPVAASARYLGHIREAWNHLIAQGDPEQEFEQQEIVLTVPASFDETARTLTAEAARLAGFKQVTLLEEPQAAFYSWLAQHETIWKELLFPGSCILVCDVGGGTTDFSLIEVSGNQEAPVLQRMAVGDHLLLGGDNMDAALAHYLEPKIFDSEPSPLQWLQLKHQAREAKEALLTDEASGSFRIILQGIGSSVVKGTKTAEISRDEVLHFLLKGFFGQYAWQEAIQLCKTSGIRSMGLPYEDEPSITKHMAHFLQRAVSEDRIPKKPDYLLFNGGAMKPAAFQETIVKSLQEWFPEKTPKILPSYHLDLAVARGAAYYGKARRGLGVRIGGGAARGFYLGLDIKQANGDSVHKALTLLPRGSDEDASYESTHTFHLRPNTPVSFQLYASNVRLHDKSGDLVHIDPEELQPLPPIQTVLRFGKNEALQEKIPVHLHISHTAIGTLELSLLSQKSDHRWSLEFQLRTASGQEDSLSALGRGRQDELFDKSYLDKAQTLIHEMFTLSDKKPDRLMEGLENLLERPRKDWSPSVLRGLWDPLLKQAPRRKASADYEARWWNATGFVLRPGFGYPLDDFRLKELWKIIIGDMKSNKSLECQIQQLICYRRIAGGLNKGQQMQIAHEIMQSLFPKKLGKIEIKGKSDLYPYTEKVRAFASLELIDMALKVKIGEVLLERIVKGNAHPAEYWALGRIGARHLFYGSITNVVPKEICAAWIEKMIMTKIENSRELFFMVCQLARKTEHREINLPQKTLERIFECFASHPEGEELRKVILEKVKLTANEQEQIFGERLPAGLTLEVI